MHLNKAARRLRDWSGSSGGKKGWSFCYPTVSERVHIELTGLTSRLWSPPGPIARTSGRRPIQRSGSRFFSFCSVFLLVKVGAEITGQSSDRSRSRMWRLVRRIEMLEVVCVDTVGGCGLLILAMRNMRHRTTS